MFICVVGGLAVIFTVKFFSGSVGCSSDGRLTFTALSFMLVDETATLQLCPNCYKAFFTENEDADCCEECMG